MADVERPVMREFRCRRCGWYLFSSDAAEGRVDIPCSNRRCGKRQRLQFGMAPTEPRPDLLTERLR